MEMINKHKFTSDQKLQWWGYGEWVEEPDEIVFEHEGMKCRILRSTNEEHVNDLFMFGGHLCGYVELPENHPWIKQELWDIRIDIHGGITYNQIDKEGKCSVGFDCAHGWDIMPSIEALEIFLNNCVDPIFQEIKKIKCPLGEKYADCKIKGKTYKNVEFAINECKKLAEQAKEVMNAEKN